MRKKHISILKFTIIKKMTVAIKNVYIGLLPWCTKIIHRTLWVCLAFSINRYYSISDKRNQWQCHSFCLWIAVILCSSYHSKRNLSITIDGYQVHLFLLISSLLSFITLRMRRARVCNNASKPFGEYICVGMMITFCGNTERISGTLTFIIIVLR